MNSYEKRRPVECLSPSELVPVSKLLQGLRDIGVDVHGSRYAEVVKMLEASSDENVMFGDFVKCAKEVYKFDRPCCCNNSVNVTNNHIEEELMKENALLKTENNSLKNQLSVMTKACMKAEDSLIQLRKELQLRLENERNLAMNVKSTSTKDLPDSGSRNPVENMSLGVEKISQLKDSKPSCNEALCDKHLAASLRMLNFIESCYKNLNEGKPSTRTTRSCSLYRSSSCATQSSSSSNSIAHAATVNSALKMTARSSDSATDSDFRNLPRYVKNRQLCRSKMLISRVMEEALDVVAEVKPVLEEVSVD